MTCTTTNRYDRELEIAVSAARAAGALLREDFDRPGGPRGAGAHADADDEAEAIVRRRLLDAFPAYGYLGEETGSTDAADDELHHWLVDPNDGTSAYLRGYRGAAVSIALLRDGLPVLGVVYAHTAPDHRGDLFAWAEGSGPLRRNGEAVGHREWPTQLDAGQVIMISQAAERVPEENARLVAPARFVSTPSIAYRLALVAAGDGVGGVSLHGPCGWDYAAGHALLRGVGGTLLNERGERVRYTRDGHSSVRHCFGGGFAVCRELAARDWAALPYRKRGATWPRWWLARPRAGHVVADPDVLSRAQGCWLGQLAGDSLGSLVEFRSPTSIASEYPDGPDVLADGGTWDTLAGQPTDDSELALMLARSILASDGFDDEAAAAAYAYWYDTHPFDIGRTTRRALSCAALGAGAAREAADADSQANGSLMRVSPIGIWGWNKGPRVVADAARRDAALTHPHAVCGDAAAVFAVTIARAIGQPDADPAALWRFALEWARAEDLESAVIDRLERSGEGPPESLHDRHIGWVLKALHNAFFHLRHTHLMASAIIATVRRGGDTDTNAAICGALLGAVHGRDAVPRAWVLSVLSARAMRARAPHPRPAALWPVDALVVPERLMRAGAFVS